MEDYNSYYSLNNVAVVEGNSSGDYSGKTLDQCKELCDSVQNCNSFAFGTNGACHLKDKCVSLSEETKVVVGYLTYFKICQGKILNKLLLHY